MKKNNVVKVTNLSKKFRIYREKPALINIWKKKRYEDLWALKNINFQVSKGETVSIIGRNGSGKSTLLKILCGVMAPTSGSVETDGRIASLLELGAGFHPELTGRENIFLNASIMNFSPNEIKNKFDDIVSFSQLEDFIDTPLYTYSSGMYVRLGFAIAVFANFDILIIDEILAVGDTGFQEKCTNKIKEFKKAGKTIIFVTHDLEIAKKISNRIHWLEKGKLKEGNKKQYIINSYLKMFSKETKHDIQKTKQDIQEKEQQKGVKNKQNNIDKLSAQHTVQDKQEKELFQSVKKIQEEIPKSSCHFREDIIITKVKITDEKGKTRKIFCTNDKLIIKIQFKANKKIKNPAFGVGIFSKNGAYLIGPNTRFDKFNISEVNGKGCIIYTINSLSFLQGKYFVSVSITDSSCKNVFDYHDKEYSFKIKKQTNFAYGHIFTEGNWQIEKRN